jgi:succinate dehydrogenase hydrophobic anchor subunit
MFNTSTCRQAAVPQIIQTKSISPHLFSLFLSTFGLHKMQGVSQLAEHTITNFLRKNLLHGVSKLVLTIHIVLGHSDYVFC